MIHHPDTLEVQDLLQAISKYNIPPTAKINLATGWECGPTGADTLYYNIAENTLAIVDGCEDWYKSADWILIGKLEDILNK